MSKRLFGTRTGSASLGIGLVACALLVCLISPRFGHDVPLSAQPLILLVVLQVVGGLIYLAAVSQVRREKDDVFLLPWIIAVGLVLRAIFLFSTPICETDFYRYQWDGAVVASGHNPYAFAPSEVLGARQEGSEVSAELGELAIDSGEVIHRINNPGLATIYPPVAQAVFALSHRIGPWSLAALRGVLLAFDFATAFLLVALMRSLAISPLFLLVYWWNPLLVKETVNSAHMDAIVLPFVLAAIAFAARQKYGRSILALALAVGTKIWPVVLLPLVLRPLVRSPKRLCGILLLFLVVAGALMTPVLFAVPAGSDSGLVAYGRSWEMNDALFKVFKLTAWGVLSLVSHETDSSSLHLASRGIAVCVLVAIVAVLSWRVPGSGHDLVKRALFTIAAVFLLSPTQFPWYYVWMIPFLALLSHLSLLLLTVLLPLYYLRFYFDLHGRVGLFDNGIVWLEFVPVWWLMLREWYLTRREKDAIIGKEEAFHARRTNHRGDRSRPE